MARIIKFLAIALIAVFPIAVSAHVLKTDRDMGIVLHVDPEDEALAGIPSPIYLSFSDKTGRFSFASCDCEVRISRYADKDSASTGAHIDLSDASSTDAMTKRLEYTFPKPDVYAIRVIGTPKDGSFAPFSILFDLRVAAYGSGGPISPITAFFEGHALHFVIFGGGFLFFIAAVLYDRRKQRLAKTP